MIMPIPRVTNLPEAIRGVPFARRLTRIWRALHKTGTWWHRDRRWSAWMRTREAPPTSISKRATSPPTAVACRAPAIRHPLSRGPWRRCCRPIPALPLNRWWTSSCVRQAIAAPQGLILFGDEAGRTWVAFFPPSGRCGSPCRAERRPPSLRPLAKRGKPLAARSPAQALGPALALTATVERSLHRIWNNDRPRALEAPPCA